VVGLASLVPSRAQLRLPSALIHTSPPSCVVARDDKAEAITIDDFKVSIANRSMVSVRAVEAGSKVRLVGAGDDRNVYRLTIRSKFADDTGDSTLVCGPIAWSPSKGSVLATDPRRTPESVWEIELLAPISKVERRIAIQRFKEGDEKTNQRDFPSSSGPVMALACDNWQGEEPHARNDGFAGKLRLDLDLPPVSPDVDDQQMAAVSRAVLDAAALWVAACRECRADHLAVIVAGGDLYVRTALARWLTRENIDAAVSEPLKVEEELVSELENEVYLKAGEASDHRTATKRLEPYVAARVLQERIWSFCSRVPNESGAPTLASVHRALCDQDSLDKRARAKIAIQFRPSGSTYCGTDAEIIACRADNVLTEFNDRDFRFRIDGRTIGLGSIDMDFLPVLAHEMGHWIGLGHLNQGKSIMASSAERARCIDEATIAELLKNDRSGTSHPQAFRLHEPHSHRK
jgi:hypothetical protein